jgi:hypothetical protein
MLNINYTNLSVEDLKALIEGAKNELKTRRTNSVVANKEAKEARKEQFSASGTITEGSVIRFLFNKLPMEAVAQKVNGKSVTVEIEGKNGVVAKKYIKYENILGVVTSATNTEADGNVEDNAEEVAI